jgi:hypothetical protein
MDFIGIVVRREGAVGDAIGATTGAMQEGSKPIPTPPLEMPKSHKRREILSGWNWNS